MPDPAREPWHQMDNTFDCARGDSYALYHLMPGLARDFSQVLAKKHSHASIEQIVVDLRGATRPLRSPMVLNGSANGAWANHALVLSSYIAKANATVLDLQSLRQDG